MPTEEASVSESNPLKWHGGKQYLAKRIIEHFPYRESYTHYVEPFFGGGAVLFEHDPEGKSEVVNDRNRHLTNFWQVLRDEACWHRFCRMVETTPFSQQEWIEPRDLKQLDEVEQAWVFFVRYRQSRQGLGKDFATLSRNRTRRGMNEQASSWLSAVEGLPAAHERLRRVVILNDFACTVIRQQDGPNTLFYCDPPYLHTTRTVTDAYECEMSEAEHVGLLGVLAAIKGRFLLSGYPSEIYDKVAAKCGWRRVDFAIDNKSSGAKVKEIKTECLWMNY